MALPIDGRNLLSFRKINVHGTRCSYKNYFLKDIGHFWLSPVSFNIIFFYQQKKKKLSPIHFESRQTSKTRSIQRADPTLKSLSILYTRNQRIEWTLFKQTGPDLSKTKPYKNLISLVFTKMERWQFHW